MEALAAILTQSFALSNHERDQVVPFRPACARASSFMREWMNQSNMASEARRTARHVVRPMPDASAARG